MRAISRAFQRRTAEEAFAACLGPTSARHSLPAVGIRDLLGHRVQLRRRVLCLRSSNERRDLIVKRRLQVVHHCCARTLARAETLRDERLLSRSRIAPSAAVAQRSRAEARPHAEQHPAAKPETRIVKRFGQVLA